VVITGADADDGPSFYRYLTFNAPLSEQRAAAMVERLAAGTPSDVLDIGCGWGELLLRLLARLPAAHGTGVDTDERVLERGREAARQRGLADRVTFHNAPGDAAADASDLVVCIGASHAFAGIPEALAALHHRVRPGGRLLFGEAYWEPRGTVDRSLVWDDILELPDLGGLVDLAVDAGYRPLFTECSNTDELDAFESGFLADSEEWLLTHADHPSAGEVRAQADEHRRRWLHGYRGGFGFAYLTLGVPR